MEKEEVVVDSNRREDIRWLLSLSESELELLISLKKLVMQRAETTGLEALAKNFNLKVLRVLGFCMMQRVQKQVKDLSIPSLSKSAALLDASNLLNCELIDSFESKENGDLEMDLLMGKRKRNMQRSSEQPSSKRQSSTVNEIV